MSEAARDLGLTVGGARVVVQGFGQVGSWVARIAHEMGCKVIAVSGIEGGIYNPNGLDIPLVVEHQQEGSGVVGFPGADAVTNSELLELDCDVLIPAAIESVIHRGNADRIKAAVVVEAANHPVTPEGDAILNDRGVHVLPTSSSTPEAWSVPTSSGRRTSTSTSGTRTRSPPSFTRSCRAPTATCGTSFNASASPSARLPSYSA